MSMKHADDIALLADMDALAVADEIRADIGGQHRNHRHIALRPELTGEPESPGSASANTRSTNARGRMAAADVLRSLTTRTRQVEQRPCLRRRSRAAH